MSKNATSAARNLPIVGCTHDRLENTIRSTYDIRRVCLCHDGRKRTCCSDSSNCSYGVLTEPVWRPYEIGHTIHVLVSRSRWLIIRFRCGSKLTGTGFDFLTSRLSVIGVVHIQCAKLFKCLECRSNTVHGTVHYT